MSKQTEMGKNAWVQRLERRLLPSSTESTNSWHAIISASSWKLYQPTYMCTESAALTKYDLLLSSSWRSKAPHIKPKFKAEGGGLCNYLCSLRHRSRLMSTLTGVEDE